MNPPVDYKFSFGPWNISEGADPFGPEVRPAFPHEEKFALYRPLGFEGVQFHDDDVVPGLDGLSPDQMLKKAAEVKTMLANQGLTPEFVAPRLCGGSPSTARSLSSARIVTRHTTGHPCRISS